MPKQRWLAEEVIEIEGRKLRVYGRATRSEIVVRVENDGDTSKFAELGYPRMLGLPASMHLAARGTRTEDIREWRVKR